LTGPMFAGAGQERNHPSLTLSPILNLNQSPRENMTGAVPEVSQVRQRGAGDVPDLVHQAYAGG